MNRSSLDQFRDALQLRGIIPPAEIIADGKLHRCDVDGKRGRGDGAYLLHSNGIAAGGLQNHRDGLGWETWRADIGRALSPIESAAIREKAATAQREREADDLRRHAGARERAVERWEKAKPADPTHPYLVAKGVQPHGIRQEGDVLLIPMRDATGELHSLQSIAPDHEKRYMYGGRVRGCYFSIGKPAGEIRIVEGFATGASVYEAEGHSVAIAFDAGNLEPVAVGLRAKLADTRITICADDDYRTPGNPGITKATEAARAVGGLLAVPDFGADRPDGATDFNDLMQHAGADAVKRSLANAKAPDVSEGQPGTQDTTGADLVGDEWLEPKPLPDGLAQVDSFDVAMLPDRLRAWVGDISDRVQCPPDFVAVAAVAALGAVLGRKLAIRPQAHTDWSEVANQWGLIIGRPGVLKSPAIEQALGPLRRLEAIARERFEVEEGTFRADALARKLRAKANERDAERVLQKDRDADVRRYLRDDEGEGEAPTCRRYSTSDTSQESLAELMRQNQNGLLVHRDELVSLLRDLDREEKAGARGFYLTGWNGNTPYTVDRIGRGFDLYIPAVCLSLLGSTQPARIAQYVYAATHGGCGDDGLIQRFGLMVWPDVANEWRNVDRWPDSTAKREAFAAFTTLDELDPQTIGTVQDTGINGEPDGLPFLRFDAAALGLFVEWRTDLERRLRSDELHPALVSHLNKYRTLVPTLALLFHLADGNVGPVDRTALLRSLAWSEYLESHARRVYGSGPASEAAIARAILARIRKGDLPTVFAVWEVWRPGWAGLADRAAVVDGLALLVDFAYLAATRVETRGRTATRYTVNPRAMQ